MLLETTNVASVKMVDIDGVTELNTKTYNGQIPGPMRKLIGDDTLIIRLVKELKYSTGTHRQVIELGNSANETSVTQKRVAVCPFAVPVARPPDCSYPSYTPFSM